MNNDQITCTLEDLYNFNKETGLINGGFFSVETQHGFKHIQGVDITLKNSHIYRIITENKKQVEVSPDHLLYVRKSWKKAKKLRKGEKIKTKDGYEKIESITLLDYKEDLYDIDVKEIKEFYANDIVSHNSSFAELPKIAYYGKIDKFKKDDISNRINKHGYIEIVDRISPDVEVTIERTFSPSNLIVKKNGEDIGKAGILDYQTYIDTEVTGLPYYIFSNVISLSINDFKSFISMTPNDKRIIIDKLFSIEIINKMNELVKRDLREVKINMDLFDREILSLKNNIDVAVKELQKLKNKVNENNSSKILELAEKLQGYKDKLQDGYTKKKEWEDKRTEINRSYTIFSRQKMKVSHDIDHLKKQVDLYNQEKCPTCETPFSEPRFEVIKQQIQQFITNKTQELETINENEGKYTTALEKIEQGLSTINNFIVQVQTTYNTINKEMNKLKMDKPEEFLSIQSIISNNSITLKNKVEEKTKYDEEYKYLSILEELYSDTGIKKKILENYLPTLNREISFTLQELHFPYNLFFDSNFDAKLYHLGNEINVDTLSTGERKRSDLAILISIIRMLKRKYSALNIFMLDEVLSSIDGDGIYDILGTLKNISKEMKINIFVINHSPLPIENFDYCIEITKKDGFSDLEIKKLDENPK